VAITTLDGLVNGLANNASRIVVDKASISNAVANTQYSLWRATGQPGQGAIPTTAAVCDKNLTGSMQWPNQTSPATTYLGYGGLQCANSAVTLELHDRVAHRGGLVLNVTTGQTVDLDLTAAGLNPAAARIGDSNFSDIMWWLEVYSDGGATASNATINVTYNDTTSGNLTVVAVGGTLRAGRMIPLNGLIPAADSGKYIADINTVTLSVSTGTAGNSEIISVTYFLQLQDFREYIEHFYQQRVTAKATGDKAGDLFAKLLMNSLYGKFGANPENYAEFVILPPEDMPELLDPQNDFQLSGELGPWLLGERELEDE